MSGPSAEHIAAVAHAMCTAAYPPVATHFGLMPNPNGVGGPWADDAEAVLSSSDPAVHAAMLDALTRAGVLTEETAPGFALPDGRFLVRWHSEGRHTHEGLRLVTKWEARP